MDGACLRTTTRYFPKSRLRVTVAVLATKQATGA